MVKAASRKLTVRLLMLSALLWLVALPVSEIVICVALSRMAVAVRPGGTLVISAFVQAKSSVSTPVKVSPVSVIVSVLPIDPSLPPASVKVPPL